VEGAVTGVSLGDVANRNFTVVREDETAFDVVDVITNEHLADSVADSIKAYPQSARSHSIQVCRR
jgi:hypothetical protein